MMGAGLVDVGFPVAVSGKQAVRPDAAPFMAVRLPSRSDASRYWNGWVRRPPNWWHYPRRVEPRIGAPCYADNANTTGITCWPRIWPARRTAGWLTAGEAWGRFDLMCADLSWVRAVPIWNCSENMRRCAWS